MGQENTDIAGSLMNAAGDKDHAKMESFSSAELWTDFCGRGNILGWTDSS